MAKRALPKGSLDRAALDETYHGDRELAAEMFDIFLEDMLPHFPRLTELAATGDWPALGALAHRLKPTAQLVGLPALHERLDELETRAREPQPMPGAARAAAAVLTELAAMLPLIREEWCRLNDETA